MRTVPAILRDLKGRLQAESARIQVAFPYFLERTAPASGARALMDYECSFVGDLNGGQADFILGVRVPVTSLCPCSKAISDYGAHNQRGLIAINVRSVPRWDFSARVLRAHYGRVLASSAEAPTFDRERLTDEQVERFIRAEISRMPGLSCTRALRAMRDGGQACEQSRFKSIFHRTLKTR